MARRPKHGKTRTRTWVVENTWKCSSCSQENLGRHMKCASCGSPKEDHEKYNTDDNETAAPVADPDMLHKAKAGANWACKYCGNDQRDIYDSCRRCGADRYPEKSISKKCDWCGSYGWVEDPNCPSCAGPQHAPEEMRAEASKSKSKRVFTPNTGGFRTAPESHIVAADDAESSSSNGGDGSGGGPNDSFFSKVPWRQFFIGLGIATACIAIVGFIVWAFLPHEEHVTVDDVLWVYTAQLQQRQLNHDVNWDGNMPIDAFNVSCVTRQHGTEDCNPYDCMCHTVTDYCSEECNCQDSCTTSCSDNGNGFSTCTESCTTVCSTCQVECGSHEECSTCYEQCPVYDEWCNFDYYTWPTIETKRAQGHDHNMSEPDLSVDSGAVAPQRIVHNHDFTVTFKNEENETWDYDAKDPDDFNRFIVNARWLIEVNHAGGVYPQHIEQPQ